MTEKEFVQNLKKENTDFPNERMARNLANSLESLSSDIFTEYIRFLFELIQNADDARASKVAVDIQDNYIAISHNGKGFDSNDVEAICSIGEGTKRADSTKTGYKGIGFKSVFGKSKNVAVYSNGFQFRFSSEYRHPTFVHTKMPWQIIPVWVEDNAATIKFSDSDSMNVTTIIELPETQTLRTDLLELLSSGEFLLFLRSVSEIVVQGKVNLSISKTVKAKEKSYTELFISKNGKVISNWLTKTFDRIPIENSVRKELQQDEKTPIKLQSAEFAEISFAARIEKGRIKSLSGIESLIYTFLPTKVTSFQFPFIVNGSFLTNASREELHEDRRWNQWLMETAAKRTIDWLSELALTPSYSAQILYLLPKANNQGDRLSKEYFKAFDDYSAIKAFIPNRKNKLLKLREILTDDTNLSNLDFLIEPLAEFISQEEKRKFSSESFINPELKNQSVLKPYGVTAIKEELILPFFKSDIFKSSHKLDDNFDLIIFLYKLYVVGGRDFDTLKELPFIYAKGKKIKAPNELCFPTKVFSTSFGGQVSVIHKLVYEKIESNQQIKEWLEQLGIEEPSDIAYVEREIINNILSYITWKNWHEPTLYLFELHKKGVLQEAHYQKLRNLRLHTKQVNQNDLRYLVPAQNCYLADFYHPRFKLEEHYSSNQLFVSELYGSEKEDTSENNYFQSAADIRERQRLSKIEWRDFFIKIGVGEDLNYKYYPRVAWHSLGECHREFLDLHKGMMYTGWLTEFRTFNYYDIFKISFIELSEKYEFAVSFWGYVLDNLDPEEFKTGFRGYWGDNTYGHIRPESYNAWIVTSKAIMPNSLGKCTTTSNTFINSTEVMEMGRGYLPILDYHKPLSDLWQKELKLVEVIQLEDCLTILTSISKTPAIDIHQRVKLNKQLGLVYNKIASNLPSFSKKNRNLISAWAKDNMLLSANGQFFNPSTLSWLKASNVHFSSEGFVSLFVPDNCNLDNNFEELLILLDVQIIDKFEAVTKSELVDLRLQMRLRAIAPFFSLLVAQKMYLEYSDVYQSITEKIAKAQFFTCSEIILAFKHKRKRINGSKVDSYVKRLKLYHVGEYSSPATLYSIIPKIASLLSVNDLNEELKLMLQSSVDEIKTWLNQRGLDYSIIPEDALNASLKLMSDLSVMESSLNLVYNTELVKLLQQKNISIEQLLAYVQHIDGDQNEDNVSFSSNNHLDQLAKNEESRVARELVYNRLTNEGCEFTAGVGENSVINGVYKDGVEYPLVVKSYRNTSYKFNIRPNEWLQLSRPNAMFWVHRGHGNLEVLNLEGLLRANSEFHVQFETSSFSFEGLVRFAEAFRFVRNVHFQLDAPNFSIAKTFDEYGFSKRETALTESGRDDQNLLH